MRYWGAPGWPLGRKNFVWRTLLDVDEKFSSAAKHEGEEEEVPRVGEEQEQNTRRNVPIDVDDLPMFRRQAWDMGLASSEGLAKWC